MWKAKKGISDWMQEVITWHKVAAKLVTEPFQQRKFLWTFNPQRQVNKDVGCKQRRLGLSGIGVSKRVIVCLKLNSSLSRRLCVPYLLGFMSGSCYEDPLPCLRCKNLYNSAFVLCCQRSVRRIIARNKGVITSLARFKKKINKKTIIFYFIFDKYIQKTHTRKIF